MSLLLDMIKIFVYIGIALAVIGFLPTVTELPFGIDQILITFMQTLNMMSAIDFLQVPLALFLASVLIEIGLFTFKWIKFFIGISK